MIVIRKYQDKDKERCRDICLFTAKNVDLSCEKTRKILSLLYNDYYTERTNDTVFVAVDEKDEAIGYILCAPDFNVYYREFLPYLEQVKKLSFYQYLLGKISLRLQKRYSKKYPAHMHIDILEDYQRQGVGTKLLSALENELADRKIDGLYLLVSGDNDKGISFYKKSGFSCIDKVFCGITYVFAKKIKK